MCGLTYFVGGVKMKTGFRRVLGAVEMCTHSLAGTVMNTHMPRVGVRIGLLMMMVLIFVIYPAPTHAMHIMEGFLPPVWSLFWTALTLPFLYLGFQRIRRTLAANPGLKMLLGLVGAFVFVLSALKMPSVTGSSSHPTGVGLGAILFGPMTMTVIGVIVLFFQAVLLAHGGLTTLGANTFSMGVVGPLLAYGIFKFCRGLAVPQWLGVFLAVAFSNLATYVTTSLQLALAFPAEPGGVVSSFLKFGGIFAVTQIPLAISEGLLMVVVFNALVAHNARELKELKVLLREPGR